MNVARPYIVWYKVADGTTHAVNVTAYDVMDALYAANVMLADQKITPAGFTNVEPDQQRLEWQRQQQAEAMATNFAAMIKNAVRPKKEDR